MSRNCNDGGYFVQFTKDRRVVIGSAPGDQRRGSPYTLDARRATKSPIAASPIAREHLPATARLEAVDSPEPVPDRDDREPGEQRVADE